MPFVDLYLNILQSHDVVAFSSHLWCDTPSINTNHNCFNHVSASYSCLTIPPFTIPQAHTGWQDFLQLLLISSNFFSFLCCIVLPWPSMWVFFSLDHSFKLLKFYFQNFLLGTFFTNGGIAILLSVLWTLYQMTFAGFFLNLNSIPPVLRWLQWLCPLKYNLEALAVNEVSSGLQIVDVLQGVPVNVSAVAIMNLVRSFILVRMKMEMKVDSFFPSLALWIWVGQLLSRCPDHGWVHPWIWYWCYWCCLVYCSRTEIRDYVSYAVAELDFCHMPSILFQLSRGVVTLPI